MGSPQADSAVGSGTVDKLPESCRFVNASSKLDDPVLVSMGWS